MKKLFLILLIASSAFAQKRYEELTFPALPEIKMPEIQETELSNGISLYMIEDHSLPRIKVVALVGVRSTFESADKVGLARLTGTVMRTGGISGLSGDEIDEKLESVGAAIDGRIGAEYGMLTLWVLPEYFDDIFPIFVNVLRDPVFDEGKIDLAKMRLRSEIARRNEDALGVAFREYQKLIYGEDHAYSRTIEYSSVDNIDRKDVVSFHSTYFCPNNVRLGILGDFEPEEMGEKVKKALGNWSRCEMALPELPVVDYKHRSSVNLAGKEDLEQASVVMGHIGVVLDNPDYPALTIMNEILGAGFAGRLFRNVRSTKGLAYVVGGRCSASFDHPGLFYLYVGTKTDKALKAIEAVREEVEKIREEHVTPEELDNAKQSYLNSFVFKFDEKDEVLRRMMVYDYYDYPRDFLHKMKEKVESVTADDVLRVAKEYIHPQDLVILAVGKGEEVRDQLKTLGKVNEIDIYKDAKPVSR
jgi:zinc protease